MRSFKISVVRILTLMAAMLMFGTSTFAQVSVTIPSVSGVAGTTGTGAITVGDLTGKNVTAFEFTITYDKSIIEITGATAGSLLGGNAPTVNPDVANGKILVAWASATPLTGSGTLVNLQFSFKAIGTSVLTAAPFIFNAGTPTVTLTQGEAKVPAVLVVGGAVGASVDDNITIPVSTSGILEAQNIVSYDFTATFNPAVIEITSADIEGTLSAGGTTAINVDNVAGTVSFAWASATKLSADGVLLNLKGKAKGVGTTDVEFTAFKFNANSPVVGTEAGQVVVVAKNVAPTLALDPVMTTYLVDEGELLTITLVGADANTGDVLEYTIEGTVPEGAVLTDNVFTWTPDYTQARSFAYSVKFRVTDANGLYAEKTAAIKVNNVNRAPVFTKELPAYQIVPLHTAPNPVYWTYTVEAEDPDNDALTFSLLAAPTGSSITTDGIFSWAPTVEQKGKSYVVTVEVTDGTTTVTSTQVLQVSNTVVGVEEEGIPTQFVLAQNYPNPFNPTTSIRFGIPSESHVKLSVFNILGQEVAVLVDQQMTAGFHKVNFDAKNLNTGMYMYKIEAGNFVSVKKMLFVK